MMIAGYVSRSYEKRNIILISLLIFLISIFLFEYNNVPVQGTTNISQNLEFEVYILDEVVDKDKVIGYLDKSNEIWNKYNVSIKIFRISKLFANETNLTKEEIGYLFNRGNNDEECKNYSLFLNKITNNSKSKQIIFLDKGNSSYSGRGCLCGCNFILISPEKVLLRDVTGWNLAHEIGHILGLLDVDGKDRVVKNLMNDQYKNCFFISDIFTSDYLTQAQVNVVSEG